VKLSRANPQRPVAPSGGGCCPGSPIATTVMPLARMSAATWAGHAALVEEEDAAFERPQRTLGAEYSGWSLRSIVAT